MVEQILAQNDTERDMGESLDTDAVLKRQRRAPLYDKGG
jgi:hypothetical protein